MFRKSNLPKNVSLLFDSLLYLFSKHKNALWGTLKHHPILVKFESVVQLFIRNEKISLKLELLDFLQTPNSSEPPYYRYFNS